MTLTAGPLLAIFAISAPPALDVNGYALPTGAVARFGDHARRATNNNQFSFLQSGSVVVRHCGSDRGTEVRDAATGRDLTPGWMRALPHTEFQPLDFGDIAESVATDKSTIHLREWPTGRRKKTLRIPADMAAYVSTPQPSPDGRYVLCRSYNRSQWREYIFDLTAGAEPPAVEFAPKMATRNVQPAAGGLLFDIPQRNGDSVVRIYDIATAKVAGSVSLQSWGWTSNLRWQGISPDGRRLILADTSAFFVLEATPTGPVVVAKIPHTLGNSYGGVYAVSPDGSTLSVMQSEGELSQFNLATGAVRQKKIPVATRHRGAVALGADGRYAVISEDDWGRESIVDTTTDRTAYQYPDLAGLTSAQFTDERTILTIDCDSQFLWWPIDVARPERGLRPVGPGGLMASGTIRAVSADGRRAMVSKAADRRQEIAWCDLTDGTSRGPILHGPATRTNAMAFDPRSSDRVILSADNRALLIDIPTGRTMQTIDFAGHSWIGPLAYAPDGRLLAADVGNGVRIVEMLTGQIRYEIQHRTGRNESAISSDLFFSPDGRRLIVFIAGGFCVWDLVERPRAAFEVIYGRQTPSAQYVTSGTISPDGRYIVAISRLARTIYIYDTAALEPVHPVASIDTTQDGLTDAKFSRSGKHLTTAARDGTALVWEWASMVAGTAVPSSPRGPDALFEILASSNAKAAVRAMNILQKEPAAVDWIRARVPIAVAPDPQHLVVLIRNLADDRFAVRDRAMAALAEYREQAAKELRATEPINAEQRTRIDRLLADAARPAGSPERVRTLRSIEILERIGTPAAVAVLQSLATGDPAALATQEAMAAVGRSSR